MANDARIPPQEHAGHQAPDPDTLPVLDGEFWDERYRARDSIWSGNPNVQLVTEICDLPPGRALDVGCGEGADAIWLATRGWTVTGVELSRVALGRAVAHAAAAGPDIAARIDWRQADLGSAPPDSTYDLVTAHYVQLPREPRTALFGVLAAAVAPGGTLLIVGHDPSDLQTSAHRPPWPQLFYRAQDVVAGLAIGDWELLVEQARPRQLSDPQGRPVMIHDAVVRARRTG